MTDQDPPAGDEQPATAPQEVVNFDAQHERRMTITTHVEDPDPSDPNDEGLRLTVESVGVENAGMLALLYVINLPAEQNPLTAAVKAVVDRDPSDTVMRECLAVLVDYVGFPAPAGFELPS